MDHLVGHTKNGVSVYVDLINSQAAPHIATHPYLLGLIKEALRHTPLKGGSYRFEYNLGRSIGYENVVETPPEDKVLYARLMNDELYSRFTRKGEPKHTNYVSATLRLSGKNEYELVDAWIGRLKPPRPGSHNETPISREYWATHAFLLDTQHLQRQTRTETCPY